jgi:hypothetical protein
MQQPLLSICICAIQERIGMLGSLMREIASQIEKCHARGLIEVLVRLDNKEKPTGTKRQEMIEQARGRMVNAIDEDDIIAENYIKEMIIACESGCDCVGMLGYMTTNGRDRIPWEISKDYDTATVIRNGVKTYLRHTNHLSPVKREIALQVGFPPLYNAEDGAYSNGLKGKLHSEYKIPVELYHYRFQSFNKTYK